MFAEGYLVRINALPPDPDVSPPPTLDGLYWDKHDDPAWSTGVDELLPEPKLAGVSWVTPTFAADLP